MTALRVTTVETPELGNRSYLVDDGTSSVVIDPQRDIDRLPLDEVPPVGLVLETHIHNDYVTGGLELARRSGATYAVNGADAVSFDRLRIGGGDILESGSLTLTVLATPGHTDTHLSYLVTPAVGPAALFTGGSLLHGSVGRTDLLGADRALELARAQFRSARALGALPPDTEVYPTHGFGSFCAAGPAGAAGGGAAPTIKELLDTNPVYAASDEESFARALVAGLTAYPAYYAHMAPLNLAGPDGIRLAPLAPLDPATLERLLDSGTVIDLRAAGDFAPDHLRGAVSIPLGSQFATYAGWLTPWGAPMALLGGSRAEVEEARLQLARIGIEQTVGAWGEPGELGVDRVRSSYRRASFAELRAERLDSDQVLDVRRRDEFEAGHVPGALNVPLHELRPRLDELDRVRTWVYCAGGFRAGTAASILDGAGFAVVHVDEPFDPDTHGTL